MNLVWIVSMHIFIYQPFIIFNYAQPKILIMYTFGLCEVAHHVCYQRSIGNNLFVSCIINKGKVAYIWSIVQKWRSKKRFHGKLDLEVGKAGKNRQVVCNMEWELINRKTYNINTYFFVFIFFFSLLFFVCFLANHYCDSSVPDLGYVEWEPSTGIQLANLKQKLHAYLGSRFAKVIILFNSGMSLKSTGSNL